MFSVAMLLPCATMDDSSSLRGMSRVKESIEAQDFYT